METIRTLHDLTTHLRKRAQRCRLAVVCGSDESTSHAVVRTVEEGFAEVYFVGDCEAIRHLPHVEALRSEHIHFVEAATHEEAAEKAVRMAREGEADIVVKGLLHTATLLRAVLNKEWGILQKGQVLTHIAMAELPSRDKLLFFTDAAVIPYPTDEQRAQQVAYMSRMVHAFGIEEPRIALIHCAETANEKFPHTMGYAALCQRAKDGEWGKLIVDGPLDLRTACDAEALRIKGIHSPLEGEADGLIVPDIEAGNVLYKVLPLYANAKMAGTLQGTDAPVVLPSRGDDAEAKYHSIALAAMSL